MGGVFFALRTYCAIAVFVLVPFLAGAQRSPGSVVDHEAWTPIEQLPNDRPARAMGIRARKFKSFQLNHGQLHKLLDAAPNETVQVTRNSPFVIALPMPDGSFARFRFVEAPVMEAELAKKFPEIKTYRGEGIDDPAASIRFDVTPAGFHAQILSPNGAVYIDPAFRGENVLHTSYYKHDYVRAEDFHCLMPEDIGTAGRGTLPGGLNPSTPLELARSGGNLRTYRLAVGATGEYTAYHGGSVSAGMAAIVTAVNRVVGVYEIEVAIRMVLVANNDLVVYTNSSTDPYSNNSPSSLLTQNQSTLDSVIGSGNYDIGHVFSTAGGGLAGLGVVCITGQKARGETGTSAPIGDAFYIDYVAHEMGHQFGANHTFNSSTSSCGGGNRNASTAYEQGSGSTIMAYAGICGSDDLQPHSDPYFHSISFDEILNYSTAGSGNSCAVITSTGNNAPTVNAGANFTIPQNTPFTLTASGSDPDGDPLTYCWEERDLGASTTVTASDNGSSPLFRSWNPTTDPSRTFPRLQDLLNNVLAIGEVMPTTTRTMNFRVTARDNRAGGGGVNTSDMHVNVTTASGPFLVTSHNGGGTFSGLQTVTWSVAGTTNSPVNAQNVNILLSTDGGQTFPTTLASGTPNDGSQTVVLPNINTSSARIKVEAAGNIFFDACDSNFTIVPGVPTPAIAIESTSLMTENCATTNNAIDPGETVTVNFALKNVGSGDTTNLVVTLLATNGVTFPSGAQNYGALLAGGSSASGAFSFVADGTCGGSISAVLHLQDGSEDLGAVTRTFNLGALTSITKSQTNSSSIAIPASGTKGAAAPFPSTISVSGVTGTVAKVAVTLAGLTHTYPSDVDVLLVGPTGQSVLLLSDAGDGLAVSGITLIFDDGAAATASDTAALTSGTFKPTNYGAGDTFSPPAPSGSFGSTLSVFNGLDPNGTWSLYIQDDSSRDLGELSQGWQLSITTSNASCCVSNPVLADLSLQVVALPASLNVGSNVLFTLAVTNLGPDTANDVTVSNVLPAGASFISANVTQGSYTNDAGIVMWTLGAMTNNAFASISIQASASIAGFWTNAAIVSCTTLDPISTNNTASTTYFANAFPSIAHIDDVTVDEDTIAGPLDFTVSDPETPAASLILAVDSSNTNLVPTSGLALSGGGSNRSLTITPAENENGVAVISIFVSDGQATNSDSFLLTVNAVNDPPILAPITNFVIVKGETLTFTSSATDVEAPPELLAFSLENAPTNATINPTNGIFTWPTTESDGPSTNVMSVIVTDDGIPSLSATQSFTVFVLETNSAPELAAISNYTVVEGELLTFTNFASDADVPANSLTFSLENAPPNAMINPTNGIFTWLTIEADGPGTNAISVIVTDDGLPSLSATQSFTVIVLETNSAPELVGISNYTVMEGETLTFTNLASDPDLPANLLTYALENAPSNASIDPTNGIFTWTTTEADGPGTNEIFVIVTDNGVPGLSATQTVTVVVLETNSAPVLEAIADEKIHAGMTLTITNVATDSDIPLNSLLFSLDPGAPVTASIGALDGVFTWTPSDADANTVQSVTVRVTDDGTPPLTDTKTFLVTIASRPVITGIEITNSIVEITWSSLAGQAYRLQFKTNIDETIWTDVLPDVTAGGSSATQTNVFDPDASHFYRVTILP